jgi:prepilin-type N-terminal cleavage/methylation domain-containing protein
MRSPGMKRNTAFTLIELIIVIVIASILASIAVTRWPGTVINLNAQTQQLASDIRYTQNLAMSRATEYTLNVTATTYSITTNGTAVNNPVTGNATVTLGSGITITLSPTNLPNNLITFNSLGTPYTDTTATTALSNAAVITLTSGSNTKTITIQPQTGRVTVP